MARMFGFCETAEEASCLHSGGRDAAALLDIPEWHAELLLSLPDFLTRLHEEKADICCVDLTPRDAIHAAEQAHRQCAQAQLLILAGLDVSPMTYLRPGIRAAALLLKPFSAAQAQDVLCELMREMERERKQKGEQYYVLETKQERIMVAYSDILFFEARERKIYLCTHSRQIPFYGTLEELGETLPSHFIRCHKGYIVNSDQISHIAFAQNTICLRDGFEIPVSRSYKAAMRELKHA